MNRIRLLLLCALSCALCCCNPKSGKWENDEKNWQRAFNGMAKPDFVVVHNSLYNRSPHFTYEAMYYFEFDAPKDYIDAWVQQQRLHIVDSSHGADPASEGRPKWFAPKGASGYTVWRPSDDEYSNFRMLKDNENGRYYVHDNE